VATVGVIVGLGDGSREGAIDGGGTDADRLGDASGEGMGEAGGGDGDGSATGDACGIGLTKPARVRHASINLKVVAPCPERMQVATSFATARGTPTTPARLKQARTAVCVVPSCGTLARQPANVPTCPSDNAGSGAGCPAGAPPAATVSASTITIVPNARITRSPRIAFRHRHFSRHLECGGRVLGCAGNSDQALELRNLIGSARQNQ